MRRLALFLLLIPCAALAQTQSNNGFLSSTQCIAVPSSGLNSGSYSISGTWSGTITAFGVVGQGSAVSLGSQTGNGSFTATTTGYTLFEVCGNTVSSGAAFVQVFASVSVASGGTVPSSNCGDATHALGWTSPNFTCQAITATAAAGGSTTQLQWNNATALGGIAQFTTNGTTTITGGATSILDLHAAGTGGLFLPGALATGLVTVTTATGAITITTPPANTTATGSNWFTAYNSATGAFTKAQPTCADLSNSTTLCTTTPAAGVAAFLATPSSANFATAVTDETGTAGSVVMSVSPALTGTPTAPTAAAKTNNTQIATTAYVDRPTGTTTGTSVTLSAPRQYFICTSTCTITMPVPAAGYEFCVQNNVAVSTVITFAAIGSSSFYGKTDQSAYGTAGTGTLVSGGAAGDKMCLLGEDATHYNVASFNGTWTAN